MNKLQKRQKIKALIVDDERPARENLKRMLANNPRVELIGEARNGEEAVEKIENEKPDLVFLDIQMPDLNGFEVIELIQSCPLIIFTTAYDEYAIKAFEINALDYLLKPFSKERLIEAIDRAWKELSEKSNFSAKIDTLLSTLVKEKKYLQHLTVKKKGKILVIKVSEIDYIKAEEGLVYIYIKYNKYNTNYTLDELENQLDPKSFFRCHRSSIINLERIKEIIPWFGGKYKIVLSADREIELTRSRVAKLKKIIKW
jgi:two-component system LytT family response regulator